MCPLTAAPEGVSVCVVRVAGGCCMAQRLAEMGIVPGANLQVVRSDGGRWWSIGAAVVAWPWAGRWPGGSSSGETTRRSEAVPVFPGSGRFSF